ncbi:MAG: acyl carrier protein [Coriobacteriales bacterium]|nr:acyl carrier protein [Coriobacteriales bacterium]
MTREEILTKVADLVADTLEVDASTVTEDLTFEDFGADSFDLLNLITAFEDEFGITLDDSELENMKNVSDVLDAIQNA